MGVPRAMIAGLFIVIVLAAAWSEAPVAHSSAAPSGRIVFWGGGEIYSIDAGGGPAQNLSNFPGDTDLHPAWSPDGTRIAFASTRDYPGLQDVLGLWVMESNGSNPRPIANGQYPSWSPDGAAIVYVCQFYSICTVGADGSGARVILQGFEDPEPHQESYGGPSWSPDGQSIAVSFTRGDGSGGIAIVGPSGAGRVNLTSDRGDFAEWSPDGSKIMYAVPSGPNRILHVVDVATKAIEVVGINVSGRPAWSPRGDYIAYGVEGSGLWVAKADGSNPVQITQLEALDPDWSGDRFVHSVEFTQAIQVWESLAKFQAGLAADGQPPVPLVAGKATALRVYFNELPEEQTFIVDTNLSDFDVQTTQSAGCPPAETRRDESDCSSVDFTFKPPEGRWTAEIFIKDAEGEVLEQYSFDFNTPESPELVLVAVTICDDLEEGTWWCGDTDEVVANARLLRRMAPTHEVRVIKSNHVIRRDWDGSDARAWWNEVLGDLRALGGRFPGDLVVPGERRIYVGAIRADGPPQLLGLADLNGLVALAKTETSTLGIDDSDSTLAHEVGHSLGARHTNTAVPHVDKAPGCYGVAEQANTDWTYADNRLRSGPGEGVIEVGYNVVQRAVIPGDEYFEIMGYCNPTWISPRTWSVWLAGLSAPLLGSGGLATPQGTAGDSWQVSGWIDDGAVAFDPLFRFPAGGSTNSGSGTHRIEVRDAGDGVLFTRNFTPLEGGAKPEPGFPDYEAPPGFSELIPVQGGAASIAVLGPGNVLLGEIELAGQAPNVAFNSLPAAPVSGAQNVSWTVSDADSTQHTAWLEYSPDNGATWNAIGVGLETDGLTVDFDALPGGANALLRVTVSDGVNSGSATSDPFAVTGKGPQAEIIGPEGGARFEEGAVVMFEGLAWDAEDGSLGGNGVRWSSSRDGQLGTGPNLAVDDLSPGTHTITLTARDADDNTATDTVNIVVGEGAGTPRVWGDVNCDGGANELDLLAMLRLEAGLDPGQAPGCPEIGTPLDGQPAVWGDVDCSAGTPDSADGLAIVRFAIGRPPDIAGCPPLGSVVFVVD